MIVRENGTASTLWDRIKSDSILSQLASDGSLLYQIQDNRWASLTLQQLQDPNTISPLSQGPIFLLRTLTGQSFIHFDGSYLLGDRHTQEAEQVVLDLLVPYLPDLSRPNRASLSADPPGYTLPLLQRKIARQLAQRLQWPTHLVDVLVTQQAMGSSRVAT